MDAGGWVRLGWVVCEWSVVGYWCRWWFVRGWWMVGGGGWWVGWWWMLVALGSCGRWWVVGGMVGGQWWVVGLSWVGVVCEWSVVG